MALDHIQAGYYQGLTIGDIEKLILWELGQVIGIDTSFDKFPRWLIRKKMNNRQNQFVFHSQCNKKFALLVAKEDFRQYKLPVNCMEGGVIAAKYYTESDSYEDLKIVDLDYMNERLPGYLTEDSRIPEYAFMGDMYGNIPVLEVHPAPDADGTVYTANTDTGVVIGGDDLPGATNNITGQATGGSTTTLEDTAVDFTTLGLVEGMAVVKTNATTGSEPIGYIYSIAANELTFTAILTNAGAFSAGDSYNILAGEYGVIISWEDDEKMLFSSEFGSLSNLTIPSGNIRVDFIPYPLEIPDSGNLSSYPEIPKLYHHDYAMGVVADILRSFHENSKEFQRAQFYEQVFNSAVLTAKGVKMARPFVKKSVQIRPKRRA